MAHSNLASSSSIDVPNELSAEEFKEKFSKWIEDSGILSPIRAELRSKMVTILKEKSLTFHPKQNMSPKYHAVGLLIAEFLLSQEYFFTVSVFTSEAPLIKSLSDSLPAGADSRERPKFQQRDVYDVLESLGFKNKSGSISRICQLYLNNSEPLIICIMRVLSKIMSDNGEQPCQSKYHYEDGSCIINDTFIHDVKQILVDAQIKTEQIENLQEEMKRYHETELERVCNEERKIYLEKLAETEQKYQQDLQKKVTEFRKELSEHEERTQEELSRRETEMRQRIEDAEIQMESMNKQLRLKEREVTDLAAQVIEYHSDAGSRLLQLEERATFLRQQENALQETGRRLAERISELDAKECQLQEEQKKLDEEKKSLILARQEIDSSTAATKYPTYSQSKTALRDSQKHRESSKATRQRLAKSESKEEKIFLEHLQRENAKLQEHIHLLRMRNIELTTRVESLAREYEDAQVTITLLSAVRSDPPAAPPLPSFPASSGEIGAPDTSPPHRTHHRSPRQLSNYSAGSSTDSSPTEDVIRESRLRLRRLEEESEAVDRSYREFRLRTSGSLLQSTSLLQHRHAESQSYFDNYPLSFHKIQQPHVTQNKSREQSPFSMAKVLSDRRLHTVSSASSTADSSHETTLNKRINNIVLDNDGSELLELVQTPTKLGENEDISHPEQAYPPMDVSQRQSYEEQSNSASMHKLNGDPMLHRGKLNITSRSNNSERANHNISCIPEQQVGSRKSSLADSDKSTKNMRDSHQRWPEPNINDIQGRLESPHASMSVSSDHHEAQLDLTEENLNVLPPNIDSTNELEKTAPVAKTPSVQVESPLLNESTSEPKFSDARSDKDTSNNREKKLTSPEARVSLSSIEASSSEHHLSVGEDNKDDDFW